MKFRAIYFSIENDTNYKTLVVLTRYFGPQQILYQPYWNCLSFNFRLVTSLNYELLVFSQIPFFTEKISFFLWSSLIVPRRLRLNWVVSDSSSSFETRMYKSSSFHCFWLSNNLRIKIFLVVNEKSWIMMYKITLVKNS